MKLNLTKLTANPDLQVRENVYDFGVVEDYAEAMKAGTEFPPITVFFDGTVYWIADGFHRFAAASQAHVEAIDVDVREGSKRDAILYAVGANADNGLRRSNHDKRNAVMKLLNDAEWVKWSDREVARQCRVSQPLVSSLRPAHLKELSDRTVARNGSTYTMNTAKIGKRDEPESAPEIYNAVTNIAQKDFPVRAPVPLPSWKLAPDEPEAELDDEEGCGSCRFYKPDSTSDQFYCLSLERIYTYDGEIMPCSGKKYKEFQLGYCECCGQQLP